MVREVFLELVDEFRSIIPIKSILELFNISKSTYYRWKQTAAETDLTVNEERVIKICNDTTFNYGYRMITGILNREGYAIGKNTVQRIMQRFNLQCRIKKKRQKHYSGKEANIANNVMDRNFSAERPLQKLSTDITYLPWGESNLYLSSIMDLYDGQIIAYTIGTVQDTEFVSDTANQLPRILGECIVQMDQGSVYTSRAYQTLLQNKGIPISLSRKGTPADNAPIESFHSSLKSVTFYRYPELKSSNETITQTVIEYIKHYNNTRIQAKLGFMSPVQYRESQIPA